MKKVFVIGGTTYDHVITLDNFIQPVPQTLHHINGLTEGVGSTGTGKALALHKLNVPVSLYSIIGEDNFGHHIKAYLKREGVNFVFDKDPIGTERHVNIMNTAGERISIFITQSSVRPAMDLAQISDNIRKADIIVLNIIAYCKELIPLVQELEKPVWTDLHDYDDDNPYHEPFIDVADYIFLSSDNLENYRQTMQNLMARGKELVVCTHGKKGSTLLTRDGEWTDVPSLPNQELVDSNGAGDNFFAGFLYAFLKGKSMKDCMNYGTVCGATCINSDQLVAPKLSSAYIEQMAIQYYT